MNSDLYIVQGPHLKHLIHSAWQVNRFTSFYKEHIIPKGIVEVIFNFSEGSPIVAEFGSKQVSFTELFYQWFNTTPIRLLPPKQQVFFGVQLQPLGCKENFWSTSFGVLKCGS